MIIPTAPPSRITPIAFCLAAVIFLTTAGQAEARQSAGSDSIRVGSDVSFLQRVEDAGVVFGRGGSAGDALEIFRDAGQALMRLRLWHTPADGYNGIDTTLTLAHRIVDAGLDWILDFHYSDSWADPGKQNKPSAWAGLPFEALSDSVYAYSRRTIEKLRRDGILPEYVQVGNEITSGMLWPDGRVGGSFDTPAQWAQLATLLRSGISGVRDGAGSDTIKVVLHIDRGADVSASVWFFDNILAQGVDFDAIGLSYYPFWHGGIDRFQFNLETIGDRYGKEILVLEVAFPWTLDALDDETNLVGDVDPQLTMYEPTRAGQADFLADAASVVRCSEYGSALIYWEPEHIASAFSSPWENMALFDGAGDALPGLDSLSAVRPCADRYSRITLGVNASTIPDTLGNRTFLAVRGAVDGFEPYVLSDGRTLGWSNNTRIPLNHVGGDYYELDLLAPRGRELQFKFWSDAAERLGINFGWDIGESGTNGTGDSFLFVEADSTLPIRFFNSTGSTKPYVWRPWQQHVDSVAVLFRVYMQTDVAVEQGYTGGVPIVRETAPGAGPLAGSGALLQRESEVVGTPGYDLYSAAVHFPESMVGATLEYKFCVETSRCESRDSTRMFTLPATDTTLQWVYYGDGKPATTTSVIPDAEQVLIGIRDVWPNPAGSLVRVLVAGKPGRRVQFELIDVLGRRVGFLGERTLSLETQEYTLDLPPVPSGLYFVTMVASYGDHGDQHGRMVKPVVIGPVR